MDASLLYESPFADLTSHHPADLGGLRIWWLIRTRLGRPVALYRTRAEWLETTVRSGGAQAIDDGERTGLARLGRQLAASPWAGAADLTDAAALIAMLLRLGKKAEQERW